MSALLIPNLSVEQDSSNDESFKYQDKAQKFLLGLLVQIFKIGLQQLLGLEKYKRKEDAEDGVIAEKNEWNRVEFLVQGLKAQGAD